MSLCKNIIMGNSSLSLWSPFLSQNSNIYYIYKNTSSDKITFYPLYSKLDEILYPLNCTNILNDENTNDDNQYLKYLIPCYLAKIWNIGYYSYHAYFRLLYTMYLNKDINQYIISNRRKIDNHNKLDINTELDTLYNLFKTYKEDVSFQNIIPRQVLLENYLNYLDNINKEKDENIRKEHLNNLINYLIIDEYKKI